MHAQSGSARLDELEREVTDVEASLEELERSEERRREQLRSVERQLTEARKELSELSRLIESAKAARSAAERQVKDAERAREEAVSRARSRLRALSVLQGGATPSLDLLFVGAKSEVPLPDLPWYVQRIRSADLRLFNSLKETYAKLQDARSKSDEAVRRHEEQRVKITARQAKLSTITQEHKAILADLAEEKREKEELLATLRAQALRLETVVSSISGGEEEASPRVRSPRERPKSQEPFEGKGLHGERGRLFWPVEGTILEQFGKAKIKGFSDYVHRKGVGFKAKSGAKVLAVAEGKVIFAGRLPGYGTVLILDHGKRYYTLYGLLKSTDLDVGDVVPRGELIGVVSEPSDEPNLHFEIRQNGDPVDPIKYLTRGRTLPR